MEIEMMMELTFDAARTSPTRDAHPPLGARPTRDGPSSGSGGDTCRSPVATRMNVPHLRAVRTPSSPEPPDDMREIGRRLLPARDWRAANRGLQRIEEILAAAAFIGLLALGTLTFGYAFDGLTAAHATEVPTTAVIK
jgi:hypothetical protein